MDSKQRVFKISKDMTITALDGKICEIEKVIDGIAISYPFTIRNQLHPLLPPIDTKVKMHFVLEQKQTRLA